VTAVAARRLAALAVVATTAWACSAGADEMLLDRFFVASRLRDLTALAPFATVVYEPKRDGTVVRFNVVGTAAERSRQTTDDEDRRIARLSLRDAARAPDPAAPPAALVERDVTVSARVRLPAGGEAQKTIVVTLQRALVGGQTPRTGGWIVTGFR
jgi:hypothetical protein